jgi:hypothetical protein
VVGPGSWPYFGDNDEEVHLKGLRSGHIEVAEDDGVEYVATFLASKRGNSKMVVLALH